MMNKDTKDKHKTTQEAISEWNEKCTIDASHYPAHELCMDCDKLEEYPVCSKYFGCKKKR